jgi:four helix bundle protein
VAEGARSHVECLPGLRVLPGPANIAEGSVYDEGLQFQRFLTIALGSATELEYQLLLARDLGYLAPDEWQALDDGLAEVKKMLVTLRKRQQGVARGP